MLLGSGAIVDVAAKGRSGSMALHDAAAANAFEAVEVLLGSGAAVDAKNNDGDTPLHRAANAFYAFEAVEVLLGSGAAVDAKDNDGDTPLHVARFFTAGVLLRSGAAVDAKGKYGWTPLHYASVRNDSEDCRVVAWCGGGSGC